MILKKTIRFGERLKLLAAGMALLSVVAGISFGVTPVSAAATYSCGTYSSGAYSNNSSCAASSGGSGANNSNDTVGTPNTGFNASLAKLTEPANLAAVLGSLALLIAGVVIIVRSRRSKKQGIPF